MLIYAHIHFMQAPGDSIYICQIYITRDVVFKKYHVCFKHQTGVLSRHYSSCHITSPSHSSLYQPASVQIVTLLLAMATCDALL